MTKNLIDAAISEKPLEFYKAFEDEIANRAAEIVANQKAFFAKNFLGAKEEEVVEIANNEEKNKANKH